MNRKSKIKDPKIRKAIVKAYKETGSFRGAANRLVSKKIIKEISATSIRTICHEEKVRINPRRGWIFDKAWLRGKFNKE